MPGRKKKPPAAKISAKEAEVVARAPERELIQEPGNDNEDLEEEIEVDSEGGDEADDMEMAAPEVTMESLLKRLNNLQKEVDDNKAATAKDRKKRKKGGTQPQWVLDGIESGSLDAAIEDKNPVLYVHTLFVYV
jgi:hypothetical protein